MMKRKILIATLILAILLSIGYAIIRPQIPQFIVAQGIDELKAMDFDTLELNALGVNLNENQQELMRGILRELMEEFSYEIVDSRIEGRVAYVTMNVTVINLSALITDNYQLLFENVWTDLGSIFEVIIGGDIEQIVMQELLSLLESEDTEITLRTHEVEVLLERSGLLWKPIMTDDWLLSIFGLDDFASDLLDHLLSW
jgi:hypothetical protein